MYPLGEPNPTGFSRRLCTRGSVSFVILELDFSEAFGFPGVSLGPVGTSVDSVFVPVSSDCSVVV